MTYRVHVAIPFGVYGRSASASTCDPLLLLFVVVFATRRARAPNISVGSRVGEGKKLFLLAALLLEVLALNVLP